MLDKYSCLKKLAARRGERDAVVTTMSVAMPWAELSDTPLDFAHVDSAMGHAADFAYGIALAQPGRRVLCLNGDGSTLMCLGTLVTITGKPAPNFSLIITENGTYEVTGNQPVPGAGSVDFEGMARAAGVTEVHTIETESDFDARLDLHFTAPGPAVFVWRIERADEPVPIPTAPIRQRGHSLHDALTR
ncbi:MAG TPA: thiamine pyrophosphate-dependent enzyme [Candidatus Latescibacteria bacterium]|jgi:thiamine pyrophosphate-dependent acetolactate synthase large subunit-like protein|nr:thiamine pyrophosphate-binding protein [Gemmatimonadaceae bacterium]MDP6018224.1 thiamine pyrophosphate-dependent enzyme [Candidatus Latescibacterota bacterium]HJP29985.1 thiamine pyrophosphate-dependent enzyme [Candidatus Latescibacterota bacterium]